VFFAIAPGALLDRRFPQDEMYDRVKIFAAGKMFAAPRPKWLSYRWLVRVGVARGRGFAFAVFRTVIVPSRAIAGVGDASGYFLVVGQISRHG
jgi:hypothetical protein